MTMTVADRVSIVSDSTGAGSIQKCAISSLYFTFRPISTDQWGAKAVALHTDPLNCLTAFWDGLNPTRIGGKHGSVKNLDEGWPWCIGAVARIGRERGMNFGGSVSPNALLGVMLRHLQLFQVSTKAWPLAGFGLFRDLQGAAREFPHAYLSPAIMSEDGGLHAAIDGMAHIVGLEELNLWVDTDMARWCREYLLAVAETEFNIWQRFGGRPQFVRADIACKIPGRPHEAAEPEVRATIAAAFIQLYAWAITGDDVWLDRARKMSQTVRRVLALRPYAIWFSPTSTLPVGAGNPEVPATAWRTLPDRGPGFDAPGTLNRDEYAVVPPGTRDPEGNHNYLEQLVFVLSRVWVSVLPE